MPNARETFEAAWNFTSSSTPAAASQQFYDYSRYLREVNKGAAVTISRGRQQELQKHDAGTAKFVLDGQDGRFDFTRNPNAMADRQVRLGTEYPWLPGLVPNGGFEHGIVGWTPYGPGSFTPQSTPIGPKSGGADASGGYMQVYNTTNTATGLTSGAIPVQPGNTLSFFMYCMAPYTLQSSGSSRMKIVFYTDATLSTVVSTSFDSPVSIDGATNLVNTWCRSAGRTVPVPVTATCMVITLIWSPAAAANQSFNWDCVVADYASIQGRFLDFVGFVDSLDADYPVGDAYVQGAATDGFKEFSYVDLDNVSNYVPMLEANGATLIWPMQEVWPSFNGPFPVQEVVTNQNAQWVPDQAHEINGLFPYGHVVGPIITDLNYAEANNDGTNSVASLQFSQAFIKGNQNWSLNMWVQMVDITGLFANSQSSSWLFRQGVPNTMETAQSGMSCYYFGSLGIKMTYYSNGGTASPSVEIANGIVGNNSQNYGFTQQSVGPGAAVNFGDFYWHMVTLVNNNSSNTLTLYVDGQVARVYTYNSGWNPGPGTGSYEPATGGVAAAPVVASMCQQDGFTAAISQVPGNFSMVSYHGGTALSPAQISTFYSTAETLFPQESSGTRIAGLLSQIGWPGSGLTIGPRNIDYGQSNLQAITGTLEGTSALQYMQDVETAEYGELFMDKSGNVRFINRLGLQTSPYNAVQGTFGNLASAGEVPFSAVVTRTDDKYIINYVQVSAAEGPTLTQGGAAIERPVPSGIQQLATNPSSITQFFQRSPNNTYTDLLLTSDAEALQLGLFLVDHYASQNIRIESMTLSPTVSSINDPVMVQCLQREIGDRILVNIRPYATGLISIQAQIQGIEKTATRGKRQYIYKLGNAEIKLYLALDNAGYGLMDSNQMAY